MPVTLDEAGPVEYFSGAMGAPVTRVAKKVKCLTDVTFTVLVMQFPASPSAAGAVAPTTLTFPALHHLYDVKSFQLATGAIEVIYNS